MRAWIALAAVAVAVVGPPAASIAESALKSAAPPSLIDGRRGATRTVSTILPAPSVENACAGKLAAMDIDAVVLPPVAAPLECVVSAPILLKGVYLPTGHRVEFAPPAVISCSLGAAIATWLRSDLAPLIAKENGQLTRMEVGGGYECRRRNRQSIGKFSEHATGNALDLRAFINERGHRMAIAGDLSPPFFAALKLSACKRFSTVLGPGSDAFHADHLHIDLELRKGASHICQWTTH